ncbi:MAG TPA: FHA domain-containing protein [Aggregatilineales bacterium]|nr:FHA domain-containing protein [Aggregatilineales bacterium]
MPADSTADWVIQFTFPHTATSVRSNVNPELVIGRMDPGETSFKGLDLSAQKGVEMGVSRQHAIIRWEGSHLVIVDLGSQNGTILNGVRLEPDTGYRLAEGDVLYIGHLRVNVHINTEIGKQSIRAKRIDFDTSNVPLMGRGQRILVVEDDVMITKLYQVALEKAGFQVQVTRDVVTAIRALNQTTPALILLDIKLPSIHGLELCRYVRRDTECPTIPIVVVSALSDDETVQAALAAGVDVFMIKPVDVNQLSLIVSAIIYKNELENPAYGTKHLTGTASLDYISPATHNDAVVIFVEGQRQPIGVVVQPQITMGRAAVNPAARQHIDLEPYGAFDKGVSRIHARIERRESIFMIEDLGSSNGTFINGHSLKPNEQVQINNGDEIRLGELRMHIYLLAEREAVKPAAF